MAVTFSQQRRSLLSSNARVQAPFIKVTIGNYTFGIFSKAEAKRTNKNGFYKAYNIRYPNYIQSLSIVKINGQVNQYKLNIAYPVRPEDDPNFFEKVFSSVSQTRKIVFTYGDASMPTYIYKNEEAVITDVSHSFSFGGGGDATAVINYTVSAVSGAALGTAACMTFINTSEPKKPSEEIKKLFRNKATGLQDVFTGMNVANLDQLIDGGDKYVEIESKTNISALDYISYLVSCMIPEGTSSRELSKDIYILTIHDDTTYDKLYNDTANTLGGPYFKVTKTSYVSDQTDAYEVDIGFNTSAIVTDFQVDNNENYALYYNYQNKLNNTEYVRTLNKDGTWEEVYAPAVTSNNEQWKTRAEDLAWWTKITKYPINARITIQGLLRPAMLMSYLRINVIFPGGHKHIDSGLYIVTKQQDQIDRNGYKTTLSITKINGDNYIETNPKNKPEQKKNINI